MKVSTEIDNNFGYEKITQLVDNIPLRNHWLLTVWPTNKNKDNKNYGLLSITLMFEI